MPRTRSALVTLAAATGTLTIVTAVLFARMPDPFVSQFGWLILAFATIGGSMLIGTARWYRSGREPRTAAAVIATLAVGDFASNGAALRAASLGVIPSPNALHGLLVAVSVVLGIAAVARLLSSRSSAAPARPHVRWAAALMLAGAVVGGAGTLGGMVFRALEPHRAAIEACSASERATCVAREEAKPLSTEGFLFGVGGFGAMAIGAGALAGALRDPAARPRLSMPLPAIAVAAVLGMGSLVVAASAGVQDLDRLHQGCRPAEPMQQSTEMVLSVEEQAFRSCVVERRGANPWGATFWGAFAVGLPALLTSGRALTTHASTREGIPTDSA